MLKRNLKINENSYLTLKIKQIAGHMLRIKHVFIRSITHYLKRIPPRFITNKSFQLRNTQLRTTRYSKIFHSLFNLYIFKRSSTTKSNLVFLKVRLRGMTIWCKCYSIINILPSREEGNGRLKNGGQDVQGSSKEDSVEF